MTTIKAYKPTFRRWLPRIALGIAAALTPSSGCGLNSASTTLETSHPQKMLPKINQLELMKRHRIQLSVISGNSNSSMLQIIFNRQLVTDVSLHQGGGPLAPTNIIWEEGDNVRVTFPDPKLQDAQIGIRHANGETSFVLLSQLITTTGDKS